MVKWADSPGFAKGKPRAKGKKAAGLRYERRVAEWLEERGFRRVTPAGEFGKDSMLVGPWIRDGKMLAQPDIVIPSRRLVLEVKLSETPTAWGQLEKYCGLLAKLLGGDWWGVQVCRNLAAVGREERPLGPWGEILEDLPEGPVDRGVWHLLV